MFSVGDDFNTPIMYKDLMSSTMGMNPMQYGMHGGMYGMPGMYPTYLNGVQAYQQPSTDSYLQIKTKKYNEDKTFAKKALAVFAGAVALGCIPILRKSYRKAGGFKPMLQNIQNSISQLWNKQPSAPKPIFKNRLNQLKNVLNNGWSKTKSIFKRKPTP